MTEFKKTIRRRNFWRSASVVLFLALIVAVVAVDNPLGNWVQDRITGFSIVQPVSDDLNYMRDLIGDSYTLGDENAPVVMIEFSDFQCPYCSRASLDAVEQVRQNYVDSGDVLLVFKHLPLSFHPNAQKAAEAAECAGDQGMFWEMHDIMFENNDALSVDNLKSYAVDLGLDKEKFNVCLDSGEKEETVLADAELAQELGITGTPNFLINKKTVAGAQAYSAFVQTIEEALGGEVLETPEVPITVLSDETCASCNPAQVLAALEDRFMLNLDVTEIDFTDKKAEELIEDYEITSLPAFIFEKDFAENTAFASLAEVLMEKENGFLINPLASGVGKFIGEIDVGNRNVLGDENAPVVMIEFSDFECPYCSKYTLETMNQIRENYVDEGLVKVVFRHFPLSFHENAQKAAEAAECAADQGMFWEMHDKLYENQDALAVDDLKSYAADLGLVTGTFNACLDSDEKTDIVQQDFEIGLSMGVQGTPASFINGNVVTGALPYEQVQEAIDAALAA